MLITFAGSLCCALSIGQFAGRLPSAGWAYTYNSRGLGPAAMIYGFTAFAGTDGGWAMATESVAACICRGVRRQ